MNNLLANALDKINEFVAILIIILGLIFGYGIGRAVNSPFLGLIFGGTLGLFLAIFACGLLALLLAIRGELIEINSAIKRQSNDQKS